MYDQSLEQLIDAVIEDGVITDKERKVIYKKAVILGIDIDEIEVYLEGRLQKAQKEAAPKSGKHGVVKKCPNCGAVVAGGNAKCPECGFAFMGLEANSSVQRLAKLIQEENNKNLGRDRTNRSIANIVASFPVPNTREDLIEFLSSLETRAFNRHKGADTDIIVGKAYYQKYTECLTKMQISFPDDPATKLFNDRYEKDKKKLHITFWGWYLIFMVFFIGLVLCICLVD